MHIQVQRLRETLDILKPAVPKKTALPVLTNVLLTEGRAMATDQEVAVILALPEVGPKVSMLLPLNPVLELLRRIPWDEKLNIEVKNRAVHLTWSSGEATYDSADPADYPPLPEVKGGMEQTLDGDALVKGLLAVAGYCSTEESRPVLTGVTLYLGEKLAAAGADGFCLAYQEIPGTFMAGTRGAGGTKTVIIPARAVSVLGHLWKKAPGLPAEGFPARLLKRKLELALGEDRLQACFGRATVITQLIEGTPPNHRQLIPNPDAIGVLQVRVLAPEMERAVRLAAEAARDGSGIVRLVWSPSTGRMKVSAKAEEMSSIQATVPVEMEGGEGKVAINAGYLTQYLNGKDGVVTMSVRTPSDPILFRHEGAPLVVMMPMFVQW